MKIVRVIYTTTQAYAAHNQENIRKVMQDLGEAVHSGINYHVCLHPDGKTFSHTAFFKSEADEKILNELPSFRQFQLDLKASGPEVPPKLELLSLVGSSRSIF